MQPLLQLSHASRQFGSGSQLVTALHDVDLTLEAGERLAVVGHSGSGKSTLMMILGLLDTVSSGDYHVMGRDVRSLSRRDLNGLRANTFGFVFQAFHLVPYLTTRENVLAGLTYCYPKSGAEARVSEAIARVGLDHRADAEVALLSGGEKQRVAIARAMVRRPSVVLADEPTGNLDSKSAGQVMDLLDGSVGPTSALVLVTHDTSIEARATRVVRLDQGVIVNE